MDTGRPDPDMPTRKDKRASPLGRGANPGTSVEGGPIEAEGPGGLHGHQSPGAKGGPSGLVHRENEDAKTTSRRDETTL